MIRNRCIPDFHSTYQSLAEMAEGWGHSAQDRWTSIRVYTSNTAVSAGYCTLQVARPIGRKLATTVKNTVYYFKDNWKQLAASIVAWGLIVVLSGAMYGFSAVALPLTIGMGCGLGVGIVAGVLISYVDRSNQHEKWNTAWAIAQSVIEYIEANGTKNLILGLMTAFTIAVMAISPYAAGSIFGLVIGNYFATKVAFYDEQERKKQLDLYNAVKEPPNSAKIQALKTELSNLQEEFNALKTLVKEKFGEGLDAPEKQ